MALTIVEEARFVTGGVDTHAGTHVAAALDSVGGLPGVAEFPPRRPATPACWAGWADSGLCAWPASKGPAVAAPAWPAISPRQASGSSRQTAPAGKTGAGRASPARWTRSAPPGPRSPAGPAAPRRAGTALWRRSGP
jgi:hypothetical protein